MVQKESVFIDIRQVALITGISLSSLYKLTSAGLIPYYKPTGKLLFKKDEIIEWIESSKNK
jgi:excisionase family DNA binding protein